MILISNIRLQSLNTGYAHDQISGLELYFVENRYPTFVNDNG